MTQPILWPGQAPLGLAAGVGNPSGILSTIAPLRDPQPIEGPRGSWGFPAATWSLGDGQEQGSPTPSPSGCKTGDIPKTAEPISAKGKKNSPFPDLRKVLLYLNVLYYSGQPVFFCLSSFCAHLCPIPLSYSFPCISHPFLSPH